VSTSQIFLPNGKKSQNVYGKGSVNEVDEAISSRKARLFYTLFSALEVGMEKR
jgi:hypothetical protein